MNYFIAKNKKIVEKHIKKFFISFFYLYLLFRHTTIIEIYINMRQKKYILKEQELPTQWYNIQADMPNKPLPPLNPQTHKPIKPTICHTYLIKSAPSRNSIQSTLGSTSRRMCERSIPSTVPPRWFVLTDWKRHWVLRHTSTSRTRVLPH